MQAHCETQAYCLEAHLEDHCETQAFYLQAHYDTALRLKAYFFVRLGHITQGLISNKNATLYLQGTVLAGYTNEEALSFVVKFDLGNLS